MRLSRLSLLSVATLLTALAVGAGPTHAADAGGNDWCLQWIDQEVGGSRHAFGTYGSCYDGAHTNVIPGFCNVHQNYPCFYCALGC